MVGSITIILDTWASFRIFFRLEMACFTGKSLSEALIFASTNPQYDDRLFIELQVQYMKIPSSNLGRTCCVQKLFLTFRRASDKDLPEIFCLYFQEHFFWRVCLIVWFWLGILTNWKRDISKKFTNQYLQVNDFQVVSCLPFGI